MRDDNRRCRTRCCILDFEGLQVSKWLRYIISSGKQHDTHRQCKVTIKMTKTLLAGIWKMSFRFNAGELYYTTTRVPSSMAKMNNPRAGPLSGVPLRDKSKQTLHEPSRTNDPSRGTSIADRLGSSQFDTGSGRVDTANSHRGYGCT